MSHIPLDRDKSFNQHSRSGWPGHVGLNSTAV